MPTAPAGAIRRYYEHRRLAPVMAMKARADVLALLEDRREIQRAADALVEAAMPYSGDPKVKAAIDRLRASGAPS
jgi:hypothetical protein